ncbi:MULTISPECIES: serine hydrolase domain-containing protein [Streptomyces]|uniref:D-alanyl-D-alanine carboxypeptidase n=1 Tax=Streptomyces stelliscabiei TaxID=146820 RepID=A0A8I0P0V6_9ACTN|nr:MULTISPECIES: serine hydrolase domain-containing protein [Streptomyces]KND45468.1 peptidase [Streptomyces stelliscabiei]MBE1597328.1 D-alanyl-D-alanine carboxypeptidase [Streptomyces stelliscabiei]MDX2513740.1 serine hydrolase [Streptomyces stelliscabiei]MDX2550011.1 serine hydrolase [Streptomyces stelliscabiei]MDX2610569.1 serine hydrolase [Streptomyces stelliscabiei]
MAVRTARTTRTALLAATAVTAALALAAPAVAAVPTGASAGGDHRATREAMDAQVKDGVVGVAVQAKDAHGVWKAASGTGDLRTGEPRSARDHFRIGSITKTFVSTVLLQLEAEGRLSLDDKVDRWLPGVVRGRGHDGRKVTLRQLLNHTSGIAEYTSDERFVEDVFLAEGFLKNRYRTWSPRELVGIAMKHEPTFAPGTDWSYSNTNYVLAGMVIEKVTGRGYGDEIRGRIIEPLGLSDTKVPGTSPTLPGPHSRAYSKLAETSDGRTYDVTRLNPSIAGAAGGMISDADDLNRFVSALLRGKLLPRKQLAEMKDVVPLDGDRGGYGLGLITYKLSCGVQLWGHSGGIHGSLSEAATTSDGRHTLAYNFNSDWAGDSLPIMEAEFCAQ